MRLLPLVIALVSASFAMGFGNGLDRWLRVPTGNSVPLSDVAYGNGMWIAVGGFLDAAPIVLVSSNAYTWEVVPVRIAPYRLIFTNGRFLGGGAAGAVLTSTNGRDWQEHQTGLSSGILGVGRFRDMDLAMGQGSGIALSADGVNWSITRGDIRPWNITGILASPDIAVILGISLEVSTNGMDWDRTVLPVNPLGYVRGAWFGQAGTEIFKSDNFRDWTHVGTADHEIVEVSASGNVLIGMSRDGVLLSSHDDGTNWNPHIMPQGWVRIASSENRFVTAGGDGSIFSATFDDLRLRVFKNSASAAARIETTSVPGSNYSIEASTNLDSWLPIAFITNSSGLNEVVDSSISNSRRFYRATPIAGSSSNHAGK